VRRARAADRDHVLRFASATWDGWDYLPHAWPRWLEADDGVMLVGTGPDDVPVAVVRVALPAPGEAWLEGIRVDPAVRGMDVATDLQVAELHWAAASGARIVRYATGARNEGSHRLGARGGFEHAASFLGTWWSPTGAASGHGEDEPSGFLPEVQADVTRRRLALLAACREHGLVAALRELDALWSRLDLDPSLAAGARLYEPRPWALEELTRQKFWHHLERGEVLRAPGDQFAVAILVGGQQPAEDSALRLATLAGAPGAGFELLETARRLAGEPLRIRYGEGAPVVAGARERYVAAGYHFPDWALHVLARPLDESDPPPPLDPLRLVLQDPPVATIGLPR
jgi:hypothetical protein